MPPVEEFGAITKWMSDPPPMASMKPPLQDKYHKNHKKHGYHDKEDQYNQIFGYNLESVRVEDRVETLAYKPNIDFLSSQNCFALNYQWTSEITLPSITLSLSVNSNVDIQQIRTSAPSGCFVVLVGAKYVQRIDDIVRMVDHLTSRLAIKLVTYFAEKTEVMPIEDQDSLPTIVKDNS